MIIFFNINSFKDFTHKLFELCNSIVASSLQQTTWLRKNFAVKLTPVSTSSTTSSSGYQSGLNASQSNLTSASSPSNSVAPGSVNGLVINESSSNTIASATGTGSMENISNANLFENTASSSQISTNLASSVSTMNFTGVSASPSLSDYGMADSIKSESQNKTVNSAASFLKMDDISEALVQQNMVDVNSYYYTEQNNEPKENYSLQALNILADVNRKLHNSSSIIRIQISSTLIMFIFFFLTFSFLKVPTEDL